MPRLPGMCICAFIFSIIISQAVHRMLLGVMRGLVSISNLGVSADPFESQLPCPSGAERYKPSMYGVFKMLAITELYPLYPYCQGNAPAWSVHKHKKSLPMLLLVNEAHDFRDSGSRIVTKTKMYCN